MEPGAVVGAALVVAVCTYIGVRMILRPEEEQRRVLDAYRWAPWLEMLDPGAGWKRRRSYARYVRRAGVFVLLAVALIDCVLLASLLEIGWSPAVAAPVAIGPACFAGGLSADSLSWSYRRRLRRRLEALSAEERAEVLRIFGRDHTGQTIVIVEPFLTKVGLPGELVPARRGGGSGDEPAPP